MVAVDFVSEEIFRKYRFRQRFSAQSSSDLFFPWDWSSQSGPLPEVSPEPLLWCLFPVKVSQTICQGWLQAVILLLSASWRARITGVRHQHAASSDYLKAWIITNFLYGSLPTEQLCKPWIVLGISEMWSHELFAWTAIQQSSWSLSWVTRITGMSNHCHATLVFERESCYASQDIFQQIL
jgi:hypothetical protein